MKPKRLELVLLGAILLIGAILRFSFSYGEKFPLHDGGFFYVLVQDLIDNQFVIPLFSSYNNANIPFVYPPLGLYLVAGIHAVFKTSLLEIFRILPAVFSFLCLPAFYFFALRFTKDKFISILATAFFSLLPMQYGWLILGGGITRATGAFFAILALGFVTEFLDSGKWTKGVLSAFFCALSVLTHPEWAWFLFFSTFLLCARKMRGGFKDGLKRTVFIFSGCLLITSPWLIVMVKNHGGAILNPFFDSGFSRLKGVLSFFLGAWTNEHFFPVITLFAVIGMVYLISKKSYLLALWLLVIFLLQGRAPEQRAVIPIALLAGYGGMSLYRLIVEKIRSDRQRKFSIIFSGFVYLYCIINSLYFVTPLANPISENALMGVEWFNQMTPRDATFLVLTEKNWTNDKYSEWVIALTGRQSVSVVQGYEWLPGFSERIKSNQDFQKKYLAGISALDKYITEQGIRVDYLVLPLENPEPQVKGFINLNPHIGDLELVIKNQIVFQNNNLIIVKRN